MKTYKILSVFFFFLSILFQSCDRVLVNGTVTYQTNEYAVSAVDRYAEVYWIRWDVSHLYKYLRIRHLENSITDNKMRMGYSADSVYVDSLSMVVRQEESLLKDLMLDSIGMLDLEKNAVADLAKIERGDWTYRSVTDETGTYSRQVKRGVYTLLVISERIKRDNPLERRGEIFISPIAVENEDYVRIDVNFVATNF